MSLGRTAIVIGVAVVEVAGWQLLTDEGVDHASLAVLGAGLLAAGAVALLIKV